MRKGSVVSGQWETEDSSECTCYLPHRGLIELSKCFYDTLFIDDSNLLTE